MDIQNLPLAIMACHDVKVTPLIWGHRGIGKSESVQQFADKYGFESCIDIRLGQMTDAADLLGLPDFTDGTTTFRTPDFLPKSGKHVIFLDEINRAPKELLQAVFQLVNARKIGQYKVPDECVIVCAANPPTEEYDVLDFDDSAFADRFCQLKLTPTVKSWLDYTKNKGTPSVITDFIAEQSELLEPKMSEFTLEVNPSRRTWEAVGRVYDLNLASDLRREIISGLVGVEASAAFFNFENNYDRVPKAHEILNEYKKVKKIIIKNTKEDRSDILRNCCDNLKDLLNKTDKLDEKQEKNLVAFLMDLPSDLAYGFTEKALMECQAFFESNLKQEKSAHSKKFVKYIREISQLDDLKEG